MATFRCGSAASLGVGRGSRCTGSVVAGHECSCPVACGIFPDQASNPCPLPWQANSQPLDHQGGPCVWVFEHCFTFWYYRILQAHLIFFPASFLELAISPRDSVSFFFFWRITFRNQTLGSKWEIPEFWRKFSSYVLTALLTKCGLWPQQTEVSHDKHGPKSLSPKGRKRFVSFAGEVSQRVWLRAQDEGFGARAHIAETYCPWSWVLSFPLGRLPTCLKLSHPETSAAGMRNVPECVGSGLSTER